MRDFTIKMISAYSGEVFSCDADTSLYRHTAARMHARGFTLIEMVIVIVITCIIAAGVAEFIRAPVTGYVDIVSRAELTDEADTAGRCTDERLVGKGVVS